MEKNIIHYIWLDKWRNIEKKGFCFDTKYQIEFDPNNYKLTCACNTNYIDDFFYVDDTKQKALEINAVVGENGMGKTSLMKGLFNIISSSKNKNSYLIIYSCFADGKEKLFYYSNISDIDISSADIRKSEELPIEAFYISMALQRDDFVSYYSNDLSTGSMIRNFGNNEWKNDIWRFFQTEFVFQLDLIDYIIENKIDGLPFNIPKYGLFEFWEKDDDNDDEYVLDRLPDDAVKSIEKIATKSKKYFPQITKYVLVSFFEAIKKCINETINKAFNISVGLKEKMTSDYGFQDYCIIILSKIYEKNESLGYDIIDYIMGEALNDIKDDIVLSSPIMSDIFHDATYSNDLIKVDDWKNINSKNMKAFESMNNDLINNCRSKQIDYSEILNSYCLKNNWKSEKSSDKKGLAIAIKNRTKISYYNGEKKASDFYADFNDMFRNRSEEPFRIVFDLSAGEMTFLSAFARIFRVSQANTSKDKIKPCLILLDEAELSLHPRWQQSYINTLVELIPKFFGERSVQVIIATHSPIMLSDIPKQNTLYLANYEDSDIPESFCANIFQLFRYSFFLDESAIGCFAERKLKSLVLKISSIKNADPKNIDAMIKKIQNEIGMIGDRLLRKRVEEKLYEELSKSKVSKEKKELIFLKRQVSEMQKRISEIENREKRNE